MLNQTLPQNIYEISDTGLTSYSFLFTVSPTANEVAVTLIDGESFAELVLTASSYSVSYDSPDSNQSTGRIIITDVSLLRLGDKLIIWRNPAFSQPREFNNNYLPLPREIEASLDLLTKQTQRLKSMLDRAFIMPWGKEVKWEDLERAIDNLEAGMAMIDSALALAQEANELAADAGEAAGQALAESTEALSRTSPATSTVRGIVYASTDQDIANGEVDHMVSAAQMKKAFEDKIQMATSTVAGINTAATAADIVNRAGSGFMRSSEMWAILGQLDATDHSIDFGRCKSYKDAAGYP